MELTAGPKLNLRIAQEVMEEDIPDGYERVGDHWEKEEPIFDDDGAYTRSWQVVEWPALYSEHIAAAWRVMEKLYGHNYWLKLSNQIPIELGKAWRVEYTTGGGYNGYEWADTAPLAICLAALKAVGVEVAQEAV